VIENASTASLVIVGRDLKDRQDKITALEGVLQSMRASAPRERPQAKNP